MTHWLLDGPQTTCHPGARLADLLKEGKKYIVPGVFLPVVSRLAKLKGFEVQYISGAAFSASNALPDLGVFTLDELTSHVRSVYRASEALLIVDVDTGFGEAINVLRTVREMEEAGAAAIQIEDQQMPKKCGHLEGKELVPVEDMVNKIKAAVRAREHLLIIARTDARGVAGMDEAVRRARAYADAGADIIFPEALTSLDEFRYFSQQIRDKKVFLLANMTEFGKTPVIPAEEFFKAGYSLVIYPVTLLRLCLKAVEQALDILMREGTQQSLIDKMMTRKELYEIIEYDRFKEWDRSMSFK